MLPDSQSHYELSFGAALELPEEVFDRWFNDIFHGIILMV
jgi:hypothetical protein